MQTFDNQEVLVALNETIETGDQYLLRLINGMGEVVKLFRTGQQGDANVLFSEAMEGLEWLLTLIETVSKIHALVNDVGDYSSKYEEIKSVIKNLSEAYSRQDIILISDIIEYELIDNLKYWRDTFVNIKEKIKGEVLFNN